MQRINRKFWILLLVNLMTLGVVKAEVVKVIENGVLNEAEASAYGSNWQQAEGFFFGEHTGQRLTTSFGLENKPFKISAELQLDKVGHTAAGVILGGGLFGLESKNGLFVEGSLFPQQAFFKNDGLIKKGEKFRFTADYDGQAITFSINDQLVTRQSVNFKQIGTVGFRPHRSAMKIYEFTVEGTLFRPEPMNYVFESGKDGYHTYRIPALVTSKDGTLLAFAEGRVDHSGDHGNLDVVLRRSTDGGKTWGDLIVVQDDGKHQCGNPAPVVDFESGRIFLLTCGSTASEYAVMSGDATREVYIQHSDDDGKTWSDRRNISSMTRKENWRWYATGPCSGIQIQKGKYKGRLVVPANHSDENRTYMAHSIYSDDNGETWHIGDSSAPGANESQIAEAGEDVLYHTMRMQSHRQGMRGTRFSTDGGAHWSALQHDSALHGPMCQGSVVRDYSAPSRLIFSNPARYGKREALTLRMSEDGGKTWPFRKLVFDGPAAYSDLTLLNDGSVGVLYEGGHDRYYAGIAFNHFAMKELQVTEPSVAEIPAQKFGWGLWKERFEKFNATAEQGETDLLLIGDSITHYWETNQMCKTDGQSVWDKYWAGKKVANFGIGSDRTQHLLYRLKNGNLSQIRPKAVVLMIGTNNTSSGHAAYDIVRGTQRIIEEIHKHSPDSKVLLYEVFPRLRGGQAAQDNTARINALLPNLADGERVIFCSINDQLLDEQGAPNKAIFFDGIHITAEGYEIWAQDILENLERLNITL